MNRPVGVIEGFYGRVWSWEERHQMVQFLSQNGFSGYWYAPKADHHLRKQWAENWSQQQFQQLLELSHHCAENDICFGVGLSPLAIFESWKREGKDQLIKRLKQIMQLNPRGLAILFDDMPGDLPILARIQSDIAHLVADHVDVKQLIVCPSYYSFDPVLEELFGKMPEGYWNDLGRYLDSSIDLFWTGDRVVSENYSAAGIDRIAEAFRREPVIWDNSIVNDGRKTSPYLNVRSMYALSEVAESVQSVLVNPMNAAALSEIVLLTLTKEGSKQQRLAAAIGDLAPTLQKQLHDNLELFNERGLEQLSESDKLQLREAFSQQEIPVAQNVINWLNGEYRFDPACLT